MLVLHPQKEYLDKLYKIKGISEMFVISFLEKDIKSWITNSYAVEFGEQAKDNETKVLIQDTIEASDFQIPKSTKTTGYY